MRRRWLIGMGGSLFLLLAGAGGFLAALQIFGNFHEVVPGQYYRSAQPTAAQIADYAKRYGIRSILNLRGAEPQSAWYRQEVAEANRLGLTHVDFKMSAEKRLKPDDAHRLVALLEKMPKPLLVHCKAGADRSGLVSAIYLYSVADLGESAAESQISFRYGHIGIPYLSSTFAMEESWEEFEKTLGLKS